MKTKASISVDNNKIHTRFSVFINKQATGPIACYIPGFDIYYSSPNEEKIESRAKNMIRAFLEFWIKNQGQKNFFLELHKLGFKTDNHNLQMKNALNNTLKKAVFNKTMDTDKSYSSEKETEAELEIA